MTAGGYCLEHCVVQEYRGADFSTLTGFSGHWKQTEGCGVHNDHGVDKDGKVQGEAVDKLVN